MAGLSEPVRTMVMKLSLLGDVIHAGADRRVKLRHDPDPDSGADRLR